MGLCICSNGSHIELWGGYGMFFRIRERVAKAWDEELGEHYSKLSMAGIWSSQECKEFDAKTHEIFSHERFKNEDADLAEFLFMSDCEGSIGYKTCGKIYNLIKDIKDDVVLRYAIDYDNDWEDLKQLLKDCYSHRSKLRWS